MELAIVLGVTMLPVIGYVAYNLPKWIISTEKKK